MGGPVAYTTAGLRPGQPVVYALHGGGNDERFATGTIRFQDFLADAGLAIGLVAPDGGPASYWHPRRSGVDPLRMLVDELVPAVEAEVGPHRKGLIGWSMGGYGALLAAERRPALFQAVALGSPALVRTFDETRPGAFDDVTDFRAHDVFTATDRLDGIPITGAVGRDDPFVPGFRHLRRLLPDADLTIEGGFHDDAFWRGLAPRHAAFFGKHLVAT
jgi:pimeloyl-ACP methyl ester carboxylesterase